MPCAILSRTINGQTDKVLRFANAEAKRTLQVGANWQSLAVFTSWALDCSDAAFAGTPRLVLALSSGSAHGYGSTSAGHVVGYRTSSASWTLAGTAPNHDYYSAVEAFVKVGASITPASLGAENIYLPSVAKLGGTNVKRYTLGLNLVKGSPNFTVARVFSRGAASVDITATVLMQAAEAMSLSSAQTVLGGAGYTAYTSAALAVNETLNGALDTLNLYWDKASRLLECHAVAVGKWA